MVPAPQEPLEQTALLGVVLGPRYSHLANAVAPSLLQSVGNPFSKVSEYIGLPRTCACREAVVHKDNNIKVSNLNIV
jgi:hypothetical protein